MTQGHDIRFYTSVDRVAHGAEKGIHAVALKGPHGQYVVGIGRNRDLLPMVCSIVSGAVCKPNAFVCLHGSCA